MILNNETVHNFAHIGTQYALHFAYALLIFAVGYFVAKSMALWLFKAIKKSRIDYTLALFAQRAAHTGLMLIVITASLSQLGIKSTSLVAIIGGMSIAIGLSLRSSLSNLASGILLILFRPFKVGDFISIEKNSGTVDDIQILYTAITTTAQQQVMVPNNFFLTHAITNYSIHPLRRADIVIGIGYGDDIKQAKTILKKIIDQDKRIEIEPKPTVAVQNLGTSTVDLLLQFYTERSKYSSVIYDINEQCITAFEQAGISIPYPQQDIHLYHKKS